MKINKLCSYRCRWDFNHGEDTCTIANTWVKVVIVNISFKKIYKMKYVSVLIFFIFSLSGNCQTDEKYFNFRWQPCEVNEAKYYSTTSKTDSGYIRHIYFIREKSLQMSGEYYDIDCKIKNGYFRYFYANKLLESQGSYLIGHQNGLWVEYHSNGMMRDSCMFMFGKKRGTCLSWYPNGYMSDSLVLDEFGNGVHFSWFENGSIASAGLYASDMKFGKWKYFHINGMLSSIEIYDDGNLENKTYYNEAGKIQADTINTDRNPIFPGGEIAWSKHLQKKGYFPSQYDIVNSDTAFVVISFAINEEGKVEDAYVSVPFHSKFDRIALDAVSSSPKWLPGIRNNRKVKMRFDQVFSFAMTDY